MHKYMIFQGVVNGAMTGQSQIFEEKGAKSAIKRLFPNRNFVKASQKEIWGNNAYSLQYNPRMSNYIPPREWVQLNELDTRKIYFFKCV